MPARIRPVCDGCHAKLGEQEPGELYRGSLIHRTNVCRVKRERGFVLEAKVALLEIAQSGRHLWDEAVLRLKISEAVSLTQLVENVAKVMLQELRRSAIAVVGDLIECLDQWWKDFANDQAPLSQTLTAPAATLFITAPAQA